MEAETYVAAPPLLNPKEITLVDHKGVQRTYLISEVDAVTSREIVAQYPTSAMPKIGDYELNQSLMYKLMSYVAVPQKTGAPLRLVTRELINNHVPDLKVLAALEIAMARYNWDFFLPDDLSDFWGRIKTLAATWITEIMTDSLRQSSLPAKPLSTN